MRKKIYDYIDNCLTCLLANTFTNRNEDEIQSSDNPKFPFEVIHIDYFGPLQQSNDGFKYIFVIVDVYSRYTWLFPTKSTGTKEAIKCLRLLFNIFGIPKKLVSDRGTAFTSHNFSVFLEKLSVEHRKVAVASP